MKKLLSIILALTMLCGTVAIAPFGAVTVDDADTAEVGAQAPEPAEDEGITDTGAEADIADTGATTYTSGDYEYTTEGDSLKGEVAVITKYTGSASVLEIPDTIDGFTVTRIGANSFRGKSVLCSVTIPDTVEEISNGAFLDCSNLSDVNLSKNLKVLKGYAFGNCDSLISITIPKSIEKTTSEYYYEYIYDYQWGVFIASDNLKEVKFEDGISLIPEGIFGNNNSLEEIVIPDTVTTIGANAFVKCKNLKTVSLSKNLTTINANAFKDTALTEIDIPSDVTFLGAAVFGGCKSLANVNFSELSSLTKIGGYAFAECDSLTTITIPKSVKETTKEYYYEYLYDYQWGIFYGTDNLKNVIFENGIVSIPQGICANNSSIEKVSLPDSVTEIGKASFYNCTALKEVEYSNSLTTIGTQAFSRTSLTEANLPDSVVTIKDGAYLCCPKLESVNLPKNLTTLCGYAFGDCDSLKTITIPKSVKETTKEYYYSYIYDYQWGVFIACDNLTEVIFEDGIPAIPAGICANNNSIEKVEIPDSVTSIGGEAFYNCTALKTLDIPDTVTGMGEAVCRGCKSLERAKLPDCRVNIMARTFQNCISLTKVEYTDSVTAIREYAFDGCTSLEELPTTDNLTVVEQYAFRNTGLNSFETSKTLTQIGKGAFYNCDKLTDVLFNAGINTIGSSAFYDCDALVKISLPSSLRTLGGSAFENCDILEEALLSDYSITVLEASVFAEDPMLKQINLPKGLKTIKDNAFKNDTSLIACTIPESVTSIADSAFSYPEKLTIYGATGSTANEYADAKGIRFVDNHIYAEGIALDYEKFGDDEEFTIDIGEWFEPSFELYPLDSNDCISLTASNTNVMIDGMFIKGRYNGDSVITAATTGGAECTFTMHVREVKEIQLTGMPEKTEYLTGEALDTTGLEVTVVYKNGDKEVIDDYKITGYDPENNSVQKLTVTYTALSGKNFTKTFDVEVKDAKGHPTGIKVSKLPDKVNYVKRQSFDTTGLKVVETFDSGAEIEIGDYTVSGYNALKVGEQTITVKYGDFTDTFTIHVYATEDELPDRPTEATEATEPAHVHDLVLVPEVPATYEADGVRAYYLCEGCGKKFWDAFGLIEVTSDSELIIPKLDPTEPPTEKPTETEAPTTKPTETQAPTQPQTQAAQAIVTVSNGNNTETKVLNIGDTFTVYTTLNTSNIDGGRISIVQGEQSYTASVLSIDEELDGGLIVDNNKVFPVMKDKAICNCAQAGKVIFNGSTASEFLFNGDILMAMNYKVTGSGSATVTTSLDNLAMADSSLTPIIKKGVVYNPDFTTKTSFVNPEEPEDPIYIGDANGDGDVDAIDATIVQRVATMVKVPFDRDQMMRADVDDDGELTVLDATYILRHSTHVKTPYPVGDIKQ